MGKSIIGVIIAIVVVAIAGFYLYNSGGSNNTSASDIGTGNSIKDNQITVLSSDNSGDELSETKTFVLTGENFKFKMNGKTNPEVRVKEGDKVRIEFSSAQGFHDWVVDEFDAATAQVKDTDGMSFVEFIADKKGSFEYYCSVGQHRQMGMKGSLIIN